MAAFRDLGAMIPALRIDGVRLAGGGDPLVVGAPLAWTKGQVRRGVCGQQEGTRANEQPRERESGVAPTCEGGRVPAPRGGGSPGPEGLEEPIGGGCWQRTSSPLRRPVGACAVRARGATDAAGGGARGGGRPILSGGILRYKRCVTLGTAARSNSLRRRKAWPCVRDYDLGSR